MASPQERQRLPSSFLNLPLPPRPDLDHLGPSYAELLDAGQAVSEPLRHLNGLPAALVGHQVPDPPAARDGEEP
jgi:hypothetical protein